MQGFIVFCNQLFKKPDIDKTREVFIIEDRRFFSDFKFHKQKLIFHRASMKYYASYLERMNYRVTYLDYKTVSGKHSVADLLAKRKIKSVCLYDPVDHDLRKRLKKEFESVGLKYSFIENPLFICEDAKIKEMLSNGKHYSMNSFYISQRKRLGILVDNDNKPVGGKWSFDDQNRQKLKASIRIPSLFMPAKNEYVKEATKYVEKNFPDNYGTSEDFLWPVTHKAANKQLKDFIENRLDLFGPYEDAISVNESFLFHSLLSGLINTGLITANEVVDEILSYSDKHSVRLNSLEGFVRQVIGWREFMRGVYLLEGQRMKKSNFWKFSNKMPESFYTAETGIDPVDKVIESVMKNAYAHHIERLMVMGNFMLLCEIDPKEVYRWFMELFIDAYDWVMVPNVYGMSQYASGDMMTTKPYISSSNYILKMSDFKKGKWCDVWNGLYWRFVYKHKKIFKDNPRMAVMASMLEKMDKKKIKNHLDSAESYLSKLYS